MAIATVAATKNCYEGWLYVYINPFQDVYKFFKKKVNRRI